MNFNIPAANIIRPTNFYSELLKHGCEVYLVGGVVRDYLLSKSQSKDIDLLIRNKSMESIVTILQGFGNVDLVGASFGIIKFHSSELRLTLDIALPRTEVKQSEGHTGFDVVSDPWLDVEIDLQRRDLTINSIAYNIATDEMIDPFNGIQDIKDKKIRATSISSFIDDPLRMLRAVVFASRFKFMIEESTAGLIQNNVSLIREISSERITLEIEKIIAGGNILLALDYLSDLGLYVELFADNAASKSIQQSIWTAKGKIEFNQIMNLVTKLSEFCWALGFDLENSSLRLTNIQEKELQALKDYYREEAAVNPRAYVRMLVKRAPTLLNSKLLRFPRLHLSSAIQEYHDKTYPFSVTELDIGGNDLLKLGLTGKAIGDCLDDLLIAVLADRLPNEYVYLLNSVNPANYGKSND
jgi:tRNA nucleotidyltransferase/poly(A) polymerase